MPPGDAADLISVAARAWLGPCPNARDLVEAGFIQARDLPALLADYEARIAKTVALSPRASVL